MFSDLCAGVIAMVYVLCQPLATVVGDVPEVLSPDFQLCQGLVTTVGDGGAGPDPEVVPLEFQLCQGLVTRVGAIGLSPPDGIWEDWCDFPGRWQDLIAESIAPARNAARAECAPWGGRLVGDHDGPSEAGEYPQFFLRLPTLELDFRGRWLAWRMAPMRGDAQQVQIELYGREGQDPSALIEIIDVGGTEMLDLWLFDFVNATDDYVRLTYDPAAHAWVRVLHDDVADLLKIQTAADCGTWLTRVEIATTAGAAATLANLYMTLFMAVGSGSPPYVITDPGVIGSIWIGTVNP